MPLKLCPFFPSSQSRFFFVCGHDRKPDITEKRRLMERAAALRNAGIQINSILCSQDPKMVAQAIMVYNEIGGSQAKLITAQELTNFNLCPPPAGMNIDEIQAQAEGVTPEVYMIARKAYYRHDVWEFGMRSAQAVRAHLGQFRPGVTIMVYTHPGRIDALLQDLTPNYSAPDPLLPGHIMELTMVQNTWQVLHMQHLTDEMLGVGKIDLPS